MLKEETPEQQLAQKDNFLLTTLKKVGYILHIIDLDITKSGRKGITARQIKEQIDKYQGKGQMPTDLEFSTEEIDYICSNMRMQVSNCRLTTEHEKYYTTALMHSSLASVLTEHEKHETE